MDGNVVGKDIVHSCGRHVGVQIELNRSAVCDIALDSVRVAIKRVQFWFDVRWIAVQGVDAFQCI